MKEVIYNKEKQKVPIKSWVTDIENGALEQAKNIANLPFVFKHIALMPDCHQGFGMPIGGVLATKGNVIPNAVGVDIGCGMCAVKTSLKVKDLKKEMLKTIMGEIREVIPLGFSHHKIAQDEKLMPPISDKKKYPIVSREYSNALTQLGTLGGGNHFIEIQKDEEDFVWIMIHSGSRNIGNKVAQHYNNIAKELNKRWASQVPPSWDLAFLPIETQEAKDYMNEMNYCLEFAYANRLLMMNRVKNIFIKNIEKNYGKLEQHPKHYFGEIINIHHNYAVFENHFEENVIVHRKGATRAREGEIGIIPGSQGTCSYIVKGLGNKESFESCSHGAGRKMGRKDACRRLDLAQEQKKLDAKGIIHSVRNVNDLDEAPGSYKDIDLVMDNQKDLVEIVTKLEPLAVIKG